jgi:hypothetical protein
MDGRGAGVGVASARSFRPSRRCAGFRYHRKQRPQRQGQATPQGTETEAALIVLTPARIFGWVFRVKQLRVQTKMVRISHGRSSSCCPANRTACGSGLSLTMRARPGW